MSNQDIKYPHYFKSVSHLETVEAFGKPEQYKEFLEKYMTYLESKQ